MNKPASIICLAHALYNLQLYWIIMTTATIRLKATPGYFFITSYFFIAGRLIRSIRIGKTRFIVS